jgi:glucose/arabinose dehydrogenase
MMFYTGDRFPEWKGNLFVGGLPAQYLARLVINGERVVAEEKLLSDAKQRIRDIRQGPDGLVYVLAGNQLLRLTPR